MNLKESVILGLKLENFKSYREEVEFSFYALSNQDLPGNYSEMHSEEHDNIHVLNTAVILGANASGKSNVIWGFHALNYLVRQSRTFERNQKISVYDAFAFDGQFERRPVLISIELLIKGFIYTYQIMFDDIIRKEILCFGSEITPSNIIYERTIVEGEYFHHIALGKGWHHPVPEWMTMDVMANHLILSEISSKQAFELNDVYEVLSYINVFIHPVNMNSINDHIAPIIIKSGSSDIFSRLVRMIRVADLGIRDVTMIKHEDEEFQFPEFVPEQQKRKLIEDNRWEFQMYHKYYDSNHHEGKRPWDLKNESMGTQHLMGLGAIILSVLEVGSLLVYDELNMALHPEVTRLLIKLFQHPDTNPNHAQLLFTTHDASVIGESLMRCDQVWLAEKDSDGCSHLFSIQDFEDVPIIPPMEKWYRSGRFGALPNINNIHYILTGELKK